MCTRVLFLHNFIYASKQISDLFTYNSFENIFFSLLKSSTSIRHSLNMGASVSQQLGWNGAGNMLESCYDWFLAYFPNATWKDRLAVSSCPCICEKL